MNIFNKLKQTLNKEEQEDNIFKPVPQTISQAIEHVLKIINTSVDGSELIKMDEDTFVSSVHHGLGRCMRNEWGLWSLHGRLTQELCHATNLSHADDLSSILLQAAWHKYYGKEFDFTVASAHYHDFWAKQATLDRRK